MPKTKYQLKLAKEEWKEEEVEEDEAENMFKFQQYEYLQILGNYS